MISYNESLSPFLYRLLISCFASVCLISWVEATKNGGFIVDLVHRESPLSPYNSSKTHFERLRSTFKRSFSREFSLKLASLKSATKSPQSIHTTLTPSNGEYLMKIGIGTPPVEQFVIADTGSDLTWIQCLPCTKCFKQNSPIFDPRKSQAYKKLSCKSDGCAAVGTSSCAQKNRCHYQLIYGDNSFSEGDLSVDAIALDPSSINVVSFPNVAFGCGHNNIGTFSGGSGIIGLSSGPLSIINQLNRSIGGKFSYCLTFIHSNVPGKISFGNDAIVTGPKVVSTPLIKHKHGRFHYLTLEGISVGTKKLEYKPHLKSLATEGNIIIDSGSTLTLLPSNLYYSVESTLIKTIKGKRVLDSHKTFKLCYERPSKGHLNFPSITAHFRGADVLLPQRTTFLEVEKRVICLTLLPSTDLAIFGNLHQINYKVGYNLVKGELSFLPTDCAQSK